MRSSQFEDNVMTVILKAVKGHSSKLSNIIFINSFAKTHFHTTEPMTAAAPPRHSLRT